MTSAQRLTVLKIAAASMVGLFLLNLIVITPAMAAWSAQGDRISALRQKVERGQQLLDREDAIRNRWAEMLKANLPPEVSAAENEAFQAINRWAGVGGISFTSLTPHWQDNDDGYQTFECRASITGSQAALSRFLYQMETDPTPVNLEQFEINTHNDNGSELTMTAQFSFVRLNASGGGTQNE